MAPYRDRQEAGIRLAELLRHYANHKDAIVLALPRGGVPVAFEIARTLHLPLDVFIVRKLGVPGHSELAMGALAAGDIIFYNEDIVQSLHIPDAMIERVIAEERQELERRETVYRGGRPFPDLTAKIVILVDDGIATGATMRAAVAALRALNVKRLVVAVPVAQFELTQTLIPIVDELVCPLKPVEFYAVGNWYVNFSQTEDDEVHTLLQAAQDMQLNPP